MEPRHPAGRVMSLDEYLAFEEQSPIRHEYVAGEVHAMTGATTRHNLITLNIAAHLRTAARARGCKVFATDVKLRVADRVYYPDVIVACGRGADVGLIVEEPTLVVEVTSPSTRATDRPKSSRATDGFHPSASISSWRSAGGTCSRTRGTRRVNGCG